MQIIYILIFVLSITIDQLTKFWAVQVLKGNKPIILINNFLKLNYVENRGAAFGILQNKQTFLLITTIIILIVLIYFLKKNNNVNKITKFTFTLILGGAVGNFIDRVRLHYVIDFIDVNFGNIYDFPVFNAADSFVVIGTIILIYLLIFDKYEKSNGYD